MVFLFKMLVLNLNDNWKWNWKSEFCQTSKRDLWNLNGSKHFSFSQQNTEPWKRKGVFEVYIGSLFDTTMLLTSQCFTVINCHVRFLHLTITNEYLIKPLVCSLKVSSLVYLYSDYIIKVKLPSVASFNICR